MEKVLSCGFCWSIIYPFRTLVSNGNLKLEKRGKDTHVEDSRHRRHRQCRPAARQGLIAKGEAVKAASRTGKPVDGAEGVAFDIMKPDLDTLFAGVDRMFLMLPGGYSDSKGLLLPLVKAAAARGMQDRVPERLSASNADDSIPYRQVETRRREGGRALRDPAAQLVCRQFPQLLEGTASAMARSRCRRRRQVLLHRRPRHRGQCRGSAHLLPLRQQGLRPDGPRALSYGEAAETLSGVLGRKIAYQHMEPEQFVSILTGAGLPADYAQFVDLPLPPRARGLECEVSPITSWRSRAARRVRLRDYAQHNKAALLA